MKKLFVTFIAGLLCCAAVGQEMNEYKFELDDVRWDGPNSNPFASVFHLQTPRKDIRLNVTASSVGLMPMIAAVMIPQKGLWDGYNGIFYSVRELPQGQRNTVAGAVSAGGLVTTSIGLKFSVLTDKKAPKPADPVAAVEKSDLFPVLQAEFGAQRARDLIFARMVEGWSFKKIAEKFFKEPMRSKAVKMANEEYDLLAPDKAKFGTNLREQEAALDAKVGQIVLLRTALESMTDPEGKQAIQDSIQYLRTEHKATATAETAASPVTNETHGN